MCSQLGVRKVLVVDDEAQNRWIVETSLKDRNDIQVFSADCGEKALELINEHEFSLVISDFNMPNGNGEWLLSRIKDKSNARAMIVSGQRIPMCKLREMGAVGGMPKPHTKQDFLAVVDFLLGEQC
ncbi:MAG: response regulator [Bdellovibrionales bacterium]|nr:response regulator [Bdellovibrionales bacterium]